MFLSVTLPKKKFQLFQPIGGVCATCGVASDAFGAVTFGVVGVCDTAVNAVSARAAKESEANARMVDPRRNEFRENSMPEKRFRQFRAALRRVGERKISHNPRKGDKMLEE
jgi:hypothetical protein